MKIKELTDIQKLQFRTEINKYKIFIENNLERLSDSSKSLYARTLAFLSVKNDCYLKTTKETCIFMTGKILTDESLEIITGGDDTTYNNKNIMLSAFKNLVETYKNDIKKEISPVAYKTLMLQLGQKGGIIRKIIKNKKAENDTLKVNTMKNWEEFQNLLKEYNTKFKYIQNQYIKTNEVPDYHFLRDCLIANLYLNNTFKIKNNEYNVLLRNEYKSLYLHIGDEQPPNNKNYFWIRQNNNDHKIIINKNKTTGGIKRTIGEHIGNTKITNQKNQKIFPLNKDIAKIILFIKQIFNERPDKPFIKCNNRELNYNTSTWSKMLNRVFKKIDSNISCNIIRKVYENYITWSDLNENEKNFVLGFNEIIKESTPTKKEDNPIIYSQQKSKCLKDLVKLLHKQEDLNPTSFLNALKVQAL